MLSEESFKAVSPDSCGPVKRFSQDKPAVCPKETLLGIALLGVLAVIAGVVYWEQRRFFPPLIEQTAPDQSGIPKTSGIPSPAKASVDWRTLLPEGMAFLSPPESFHAETLSDKINGKADLYLSAGFLRLETRRLRPVTADEVWIEAWIYEMRDPEAAFSVYSLQKRTEAVPVAMGRAAYQTPNALFVVYGSYYLEFIASSEIPSMVKMLETLGRAVMKVLPEADRSGAVPPFFPQEGLDPESIMLIAADAFGFERLDKVFTAGYQMNGIRLTAFVSPRLDPEEANRLALEYRDFLLQFGAEPMEAGFPQTGSMAALSVMGEAEVIFSQGAYLAGVHQAQDPEKALALAIMLNKYLMEYNETN